MVRARSFGGRRGTGRWPTARVMARCPAGVGSPATMAGRSGGVGWSNALVPPVSSAASQPNPSCAWWSSIPHQPQANDSVFTEREHSPKSNMPRAKQLPADSARRSGQLSCEAGSPQICSFCDAVGLPWSCRSPIKPSRSVERQLKAEYARKAYMQKLALTSAARRRKTSTALCMNAVSHGTSTGSSGAWPSMVSSRRRCDTGVTVARSSFPTVEGQASAFCDPTTDPRRMFRQRMSAS